MFKKKWNLPYEIIKRTALVSITGVIIIGLGASIIYQGEVYSAEKSKKEDTAVVYEALAAANETPEINEPETKETETKETETETVKASTPETGSEKITETHSKEDAPAETESYSSLNNSDIPENSINVFMNLLQLHPNYLSDILSLRESWNELETKLTETVEGYSGDWSVYVKDIKTGNTISLNEHSMESASLIKLYVMGAVMEQIYNGTLEETSRITSLLNDMITVSDNEATNELVRSLSESRNHTEGMAVVNDFIKRHGFKNTKQINGLADSRLWSGNGVNTTSTQDCGKLFESIYNGELVSHMASHRMESLLLGQKVTYKIPQALPDGTISASKTGEVSGVENDTAIIYSKGGDFILCIMSADWYSQTTAISNIHEITKIVYEYFNS